MIYTVWFDSGKGLDWWGEYSTKASADKAARHLMADKTVSKVTIDISRKGAE